MTILQHTIASPAINLVRPSTFQKERSQKNKHPNTLLKAIKNQTGAEIESSIKQLQKNKPSDFDAQSKSILKELLLAETQHKKALIFLAGYIGLDSSFLSEIGMQQKSKTIKQATRLARVRLGDKKLLKNLMENIRKVPINDDFVYDLAPYLVYVRQKEAMDYLLELILDDTKSCYPADAELSGKILCAYRLVEMVAPVIKDFPIQVNAKTGDLVTDDYPTALQEVRTWMTQNKNTYQLKYNLY